MSSFLDSAIAILGAQGSFNLSVFGKLLLAVGIGILIGIERELASIESGHHKLAGLRTIIFVVLLGGLSVLVDPSGLLPVVGFVMTCVLLTVAYVIVARANGEMGLTTPTVTILAYLLGAMVFLGPQRATFAGQEVTLNLTSFAVTIAIVVTLILSLKLNLERFVSRITPDEFFSSLKFAVIAFIVLPFLPDKPLSTYVDVDVKWVQAVLSGINPHGLWTMVVLISGISFVGYILSKLLGAKRGVSLSGFLGGLASSTAVTSSMAARSRGRVSSAIPYVLATIIASATSFVRVLAEVAVVNRSLVSAVALPMVGMTVVAFAAIFFLPKDTGAKGDTHVDHESPFSLGPALKLTGMILLIKVVMKLALAYEVPGGLYVTSFISGLADVDAVTLNASGLALEGVIARDMAATAITLAVLSNMAVKTGIAVMAGSPDFGRRIRPIFIAVIVVGLLAAVVPQLL